MQGPRDAPGIIPRALAQVFRHVISHSNTHDFKLTMSYVELYNEDVFDLLAPVNPDPVKGSKQPPVN